MNRPNAFSIDIFSADTRLTVSRATRALMAILLMAFNLEIAAQDALPEDAIKAGYIYHFGVLTDWPEQMEGLQVNLCIYGNSKIKSELVSLIGKKVDKREYRVYEIDFPAPPPECHLLFVGRKDLYISEKLIKSYSDRPTLTVTDDENLSKLDVAIFIRPEGKRLAFEIDNQVAKAANLTLSSRLLRLGR